LEYSADGVFNKDILLSTNVVVFPGTRPITLWDAETPGVLMIK
jgi:hypothetical protein